MFFGKDIQLVEISNEVIQTVPSVGVEPTLGGF